MDREVVEAARSGDREAYADLIRVLEKTFTFTREMWLVMHEDAKATRRIRLLFDHLVEGLTGYVRDGS